jgi:hypothetical protein
MLASLTAGLQLLLALLVQQLEFQLLLLHPQLFQLLQLILYLLLIYQACNVFYADILKM